MRNTLWILAAIAAALLAGIALGRWGLDGNASDSDAGARKPLYWAAPMDPGFRSDKPGKSPMGMDLVPVYADDQPADADPPGTVRIDPAVINNLGVRSAPVEGGPLHRLIDTVGYVEYAEDSVEHIHPRVEGWIEELKVRDSGDSIHRGGTLFRLYSRELVTAQQEYLTARRSHNTQLVAAARERLQTFGMDPGQVAALEKTGRPMRTVAVSSPIDGVVAELNVREGMFVKPGTEVMSLAALDRVWVTANVFERDAELVHKGQAVDVSFAAVPGRTWNEVVDYVYPELDAATRSIAVRIRLDNPEHLLKPNMFARVRIHGQSTGPTLSVPVEALIRGSVNRVVLATGDGRFRTVPVRVGIEAGDRVQILDGLQADDRVVVSGQFLIDSESSVDAEELRAETPVDPSGKSQGHEMSGHKMPAKKMEEGAQ